MEENQHRNRPDAENKNKEVSLDMRNLESGGNQPPSWLDDVNLAAQYLTRLSLESAAKAALIVSKGKLWAYAGELPQAAAEELSQLASSYWLENGGSDLVRFIRLGAASGEYMLYATGIGWNMLLALVFDVETPFSKIRSQATLLAEKLTHQPEDEVPPSLGEYLEPVDEYHDVDDGEDEVVPLNLPPLLDDVPPPVVTERGEGWSYIDPKDFSYVEAAYKSLESQEESEQVNQAEVDAIIGQVPEDKHPDVEEISIKEAFKPVDPSVSQLLYACLLIPRLPQHYLAGDLAGSLSGWLKQLSIVFGWRLVHLTIRPDHLHWIVNVPPNTSPGYMLRQIRKLTSEYIFEDFPRLRRENPSGDFWAPGYLVTSSTRPISGKIVREFIEHTRARQGASSKKSIL
jgi:putative transposase